MIAALLNRLNPYMLYIKVGAAVVLALGSAYGGYKVTDLYWSAKYNAVELARSEAVTASLTAARKADRAQAAVDRSVVSAHEESAIQLDNSIRESRNRIQETKDEVYKPATEDRPFTIRFVWDFNSLSNGGADRASVSGTTEDSSGVVKENAVIADVTRKDLLALHADQMSLCLGWKQQLDDIIAWDAKTYGAKK